MPTPLDARLDRLRHRIARALDSSGRTGDVTLELAVKTRSAEECRAAAHCLTEAGLPVLLGHNKVQEACATASAIREVPGARIHLIGHLQSNKINHALTCIDLIETIDSVALVERIDARARRFLPVFVQVNVSGEASKHGCDPQEVPALVEAVEAAHHLSLDGFMTVGLNSTEEGPVRRAYARLRELRDAVAERLQVADEDLDLSMGMSRDLEWAIAEGATIVRVGTDAFGPRALPA